MDESNFYEVDKILKKRIRNGKTQYYVKWANYGDEDNSWTSSTNFKSSQLVREFESRLLKKRSKSAKNMNSKSKSF